MNITNVIAVLKNLKAVLEEKDTITQMSENTIVLKNGIEFSKEYGICSNVDLWSLDDSIYVDLSDIFIYSKTVLVSTLMDKLAYSFILTKNPDFVYGDLYRSIANPIYDSPTHINEKWLNPERWEYVDFLIRHLEKIVDDETYVVELFKIGNQYK